MKKIRYGIIGCGTIHHSHVSALAKLEDIAELVAVCDSDASALVAATAKNNVVGFNDYRDLVASPAIDAVLVCTPSGLHGDHSIAALKAQKHVLSEKPIEISLSKTDEMIAAAKQNRVLLSAISQTRYGSGISKLHSWLDEGRLGRIVYGEAQIKRYRSQEYYDSAGWRGTWEFDGGGALMNQGVHYVDQLRWAMGRPRSVKASMGTLGHKRIDVEDIVSATIEFENGSIGTLVATTCAYPGLEARIEIYGTAGTARIVDGSIEMAEFLDGEVYKPAVPTTTSTVGADPRSAGINEHWHQLRDFTMAIIDGREPEITAVDGRNALELVLAVYESARTGATVYL